MTTARNTAAAALDAAQQRLTALLLAEHRDVPAIVEAAAAVERAERAAQRRPVLRAPLFRTPAR